MDFELGEAADALRVRLRDLIHEHIRPGFLGAFSNDPADLALTQQFCKILADEGLLCLTWPQEYGGGGGSVWEQTTVREEMWAHHEPRGAQYMGVNWVGPALMRHGTDEQRAKHLPPISSGDVIWCQGFSEPEAGSDLASLRTRAVPDGDGWLITGQKVWTSYAQMASWCVLAACTDPELPSSQRLTLFIVPMDREGIEVRPIASMLGPHHLNEVFIDNVRVSRDEVLGEVGGGWTVMRDALAYERVGIARYARCESLLERLKETLAQEWDALPPALHTRWVRALISLRTARLLAYRAVADQGAGINPVDASASRIVTTTCDQISAELLVEAAGAASLDSGANAPIAGAIDDHWRYAQAATVASGTIEVQRMLVARDVLGGAAVNATFPQDVVDFADAAQRRLERLGGVDFALRAEHERSLREQAAQALADLGASELDVRTDLDQMLAGAALCRASGAVALPWPVVEDLMRVGDQRLALVDLATPRVDHGDLAGDWLGADLDGTCYLLSPGSAGRAKLGPFLVPATTAAQQPDVEADDLARHLVLGVWRLLGGLEAALAQVVDHVGKRTQFGKTLSEFQTVRFAVADATVALRGLEELAKYTTWRLDAAPPSRRQTDALALRLSGADTAVAVLRTCHQLLGAVGFCDEHDVSVFDRHLQPLIRLPLSAERLALRLVPAVRSGDFETLFS